MGAAETLYESLSYDEVLRMIAEGEAEHQHLECKAPAEPKISKDVKAHLAKTVSAFANSEGGVILYGVATKKHQQDGSDVLVEAETVANAETFARRLVTVVPGLVEPNATGCQARAMTESPSRRRGLVALYVPSSESDPLRSSIDHQFYFRSGDESIICPYTILARLFAATKSPDLHLVPPARFKDPTPEGVWEIPLTIENRSSAVGRDVHLSAVVMNPESVADVSGSDGLRDMAGINPGLTVFMYSLRQGDGVVHKGLRQSAGFLVVRMAPRRRAVNLLISLYADRMVARAWRARVNLTRQDFILSSFEGPLAVD